MYIDLYMAHGQLTENGVVAFSFKGGCKLFDLVCVFGLLLE